MGPPEPKGWGETIGCWASAWWALILLPTIGIALLLWLPIELCIECLPERFQPDPETHGLMQLAMLLAVMFFTAGLIVFFGLKLPGWIWI